MDDPNRKVSDLYFKVVDPKLQVADLKAEVEELRTGGIPSNLTPATNELANLAALWSLIHVGHILLNAECR